jgi:hypothetical protein
MTTTRTKPTLEQWLAEGRRYASHIWCYPGMIDEFPDDAKAAYERGDGCYAYVESFGERYALDRADQNWGINQNVPFEKQF